MLATINWLRDFVDIDMDVEKLADLLTMSGLEVDSVTKIGDDLKGIVVAEIMDVSTHPKGGNLYVAKVSNGAETFQVVSAAPNTKVGLKTALAPPGVVLPTGLKIEKRDFKGVESTGVLLAEDEMGLTHDHTGLIELDPKAAPGKSLAETLNLSDYLIDIDLTPNRSDCLSVIGLAREISALTGAPLRLPKTDVKEEGPDINELTSIEVIDKDLCPRYVARVVQDIKIRMVPFWMRLRINQLGMRDINNIVDITNYILMEYGQPLHAFDYDLLSGNRIVVKRAKEGEKFFTLDAVERTLNKDVLMIADAERSVAIGGVMGGANSEIQEDTANVLLESAFFHPPSIHKTARELGLLTDAAFRFERGIDPEGCKTAADRAAALMAEYADGTVAKGYIDVKGDVPKRPTLKIRTSMTNKVIGFKADTKEIRKYLESLFIKVEDESKDELLVTPPSYRLDLEREIDLIEEVARLKGYDNIPETLPNISMDFSKTSEIKTLIDLVSDAVLSEGFNEIITYSFIGSVSFDKMRLSPKDPMRKATPLKNPLSEEMDVMRTTLVPGILQTAETNINYLSYDLRLFEIARVFMPRNSKGGKGEGEGGDNGLPDERFHLSLLISGKRRPKQWGADAPEVDFFDLKGVWEKITDEIGFVSIEYEMNKDVEYLDKTQSCVIRGGGETIGVMGRIDPDVMDNFNISRDTYILEADLNKLIKLDTKVKTFSQVLRYPPVMRDIAIVIADDVNSDRIVKTVEGAAGELVKEVTIFDLYQGEQIERGSKSIALTVKYQSDNRTLTDDEVNKKHGEVLDILKKKLGAQIR
ncbi:MAG: phenylalanine--tRNA ligase subunit beta [Deltaproteobacteria bacterium]|uniref:Phenylalanine--tRNA ligase beta subunit n=1 Tax=Candidatus Zymogenus saltonus TaxID=2844893 RepID=A0A9D8KGZ9_9DELT|nr:phenylalanine--tRNA ligase subunit beta [Candidatus Zymogenus saltonus]